MRVSVAEPGTASPPPGAHPSTQVSKPTAWPFSLHLALASHTCEKQGSGAARWRPE